MDFVAGEVLYIDKPLGWTSFDVVNKIRYNFKTKLGIKKIKVGHAGTLDPLATGVVIICTGKATKRIEEYMGHDKEYLATIRLGATTPSYDLEKNIDATYPYEHITHEKVKEVLQKHFTGEIDQVPPMFSAIRIDGKRAYEYARKGDETVELKSRKITIHNIEIEKIALPDVTLRIRCSKGTYIRSIARDLGLALESGGHLIALERTAVGDVRKEDTQSVEEFLALLDKMEKHSKV